MGYFIIKNIEGSSFFYFFYQKYFQGRYSRLKSHPVINPESSIRTTPKTASSKASLKLKLESKNNFIYLRGRPRHSGKIFRPKCEANVFILFLKLTYKQKI